MAEITKEIVPLYEVRPCIDEGGIVISGPEVSEEHAAFWGVYKNIQLDDEAVQDWIADFSSKDDAVQYVHLLSALNEKVG